jgi:hypothetical protein
MSRKSLSQDLTDARRVNAEMTAERGVMFGVNLWEEHEPSAVPSSNQRFE